MTRVPVRVARGALSGLFFVAYGFFALPFALLQGRRGHWLCRSGLPRAREGRCAHGRKNMEETKQKLKVYCETSFWIYLTGRPSAVQKTAYWQSLTRIWWSFE